MNIKNTNSIGQIVADDYRTASVFKSHGIDFCCNGNRTLSEVCGNKDISEDKLQQELDGVLQENNAGNTNFKSWPLDLLADYIEKKHHRYVRSKSTELHPYLEKICKVHGQNHPELFEIKSLFEASTLDLLSHMTKEEKILFPAIRTMMESDVSPKEISQKPIFGTIEMPIAQLMKEHNNEGERFRKIAALSADYTPPASACATYEVTFSLLQEFENDLHHHIHLENNILFPAAIEMEKDLSYA